MRHDSQLEPVPADGFDISLEDVLKSALATGAALVLLLPGARGFSETLGWLPLWLLGMPAVALWALKGLPLPGARPAQTQPALAPRRRRSGPQARRRARGGVRSPLSRAA